jgi:hypothetical protein
MRHFPGRTSLNVCGSGCFCLLARAASEGLLLIFFPHLPCACTLYTERHH